MANFRVGQKVMCIDASVKLISIGDLKEGNIYTIEQLVPKVGGVVLVEIKAPYPAMLGCYAQSRFVPFKNDDIENIFSKCIEHELVGV